MMEEAEKNAFVDQSKKSLIVLIYASDTVLSRMERVLKSDVFKYRDPEPAGYLFRKSVDHMECYLWKKDLKSLAKVIEGKFIPMSIQGLIYNLLKAQFELNRRARNKKLIIDIDFDDPEPEN